jgi:hypothetical protein
MKSALVLMLLSTCALAQSATSACGPAETKFEVKLDDSQHTLSPPEAGKARVYFVQDLGWVSCIGGCLDTRIAVDGTWVGATNKNSYISVSIDPGEHHVCAGPQGLLVTASRKNPSVALALAHFRADAGKVYYFRIRFFSGERQGIFDLEPIDSDEGVYLIEHYPLSVSHPKPAKLSP